MKKIAALVSIALFAWGSAAHAHGGSRQKVVESIEINAAPDAVWDIIKEFGNAKWIPAVESTTVNNVGDKVVRTLLLKDGGEVNEELKEVDEATKTLKYRVHQEPVSCKVFPTNTYSAALSITAAGAGSKVEWMSAAYRCFTPNNPPPGEDEKAAVEAMTCLSKEALANLKVLAEKP